MELLAGNIVYIKRVEPLWDNVFVMKRHHAYNSIRYVILKAKITEICKDEFKAILFENNGFDKDGGQYVFHKNDLIQNQNYVNKQDLGTWIINKEIA